MAELTVQERLQPSLLDRLTDDEPGSQRESRDQRVLSLRRLREVVLRDMQSLLNTTNLAASEDLTRYPQVANSVVNYGIPDLTGATASSVDPTEIERAIRQAVWDYEPRLLRESVQVRVRLASGQMTRNALSFEIEAELWAQPLPLHLFLRTEVDLETGHSTVTEGGGQG